MLEWLQTVVICLQISIFELLNTTRAAKTKIVNSLWFAYKLVSLNYWIQLPFKVSDSKEGCDLLTN